MKVLALQIFIQTRHRLFILEHDILSETSSPSHENKKPGVKYQNQDYRTVQYILRKPHQLYRIFEKFSKCLANYKSNCLLFFSFLIEQPQ
jgi:hypothetical protein